MAEIVNLRAARKRARRAQDEAQARENRAIHGRSGADRGRDAAQNRQAAQQLDAHKRDRGDEP